VRDEIGVEGLTGPLDEPRSLLSIEINELMQEPELNMEVAQPAFLSESGLVFVSERFRKTI